MNPRADGNWSIVPVPGVKLRFVSGAGGIAQRFVDYALSPAGQALVEQHTPSALQTQTLHAAEDWRTRLVADDDALGQWINLSPRTDSQQLRPYALARWSMTPTQLLGQRLRDTLGQRHTVLRPGDETIASETPARQRPLALRIELEEFSQLFMAPGDSVGLLRLRATVVQIDARATPLVAQRSFTVQRNAASADAPGAARALSAATDAALQELDQWLQELGRP